MWIWLVLLVLMLVPSVAVGAEARCAEVDAQGGVCLCSEPFQMTGFSELGTSGYFNPNDSTTKECNTEGVGVGYALTRTRPIDLIGSSDATILGALPAGNSVARVLKAPEAHTGLWNIGHMLTVSDPTARFSARWYLYYSPNFVFDDKVTCLNSEKWMVGSTNLPNNPQSGIRDNGSAAAGFNNYAWVGWTPQLDCCGGALGGGTPGYNTAGPVRSLLPGRWWRFELVVRNRTGPGLVFELWLKNVTNNGPNIKVMDTSIPCSGCGSGELPINDWSVASGATTTLRPPLTYKETRTEHFRNGTCPGFYAVSHWMVAAWNVDAGQLIGGASEVEGSQVPGTPSGLTVTKLQPVRLSPWAVGALRTR